jgi:hypothetical protein
MKLDKRDLFNVIRDLDLAQDIASGFTGKSPFEVML